MRERKERKGKGEMDEAAARRRENVMEGGMEMDGRRRVDKDRNRAGERQS